MWTLYSRQFLRWNHLFIRKQTWSEEWNQLSKNLPCSITFWILLHCTIGYWVLITIIFVVQRLTLWALKPEIQGPFFSKTMNLLLILLAQGSGAREYQNFLLLPINIRIRVQLAPWVIISLVKRCFKAVKWSRMVRFVDFKRPVALIGLP